MLLIIVVIFINSNTKNLLGGRTIKIENESNNEIANNNQENNEEENEAEENYKKSLLNGIECENANRRPFAVMLAGDLEAWPLSGIAKADLVIEMPVVTGGITRYLAIYVCNNPTEIGSIRSA